jgi:hypothetical protein
MPGKEIAHHRVARQIERRRIGERLLGQRCREVLERGGERQVRDRAAMRLRIRRLVRTMREMRRVG